MILLSSSHFLLLQNVLPVCFDLLLKDKSNIKHGAIVASDMILLSPCSFILQNLLELIQELEQSCKVRITQLIGKSQTHLQENPKHTSSVNI